MITCLDRTDNRHPGRFAWSDEPLAQPYVGEVVAVWIGEIFLALGLWPEAICNKAGLGRKKLARLSCESGQSQRADGN